MRVAFHTLGCKVNHYETEAIKEAFVSRGAKITGEEDPADVYIINTCTVTNIADRKSRQFIRRAKKINPDAIIVVTGCYAQVASEEVAEMPEVDLVVGNRLKSEICGMVSRLMDEKGACKEEHEEAGGSGDNATGHSKTTAGGQTQTARECGAEPDTSPRAAVKVLPRKDLTFYEDMGRVEAGADGMSRAYIKIQDGCDRFCSYCLIPYARGPVCSRPAADVLEEVKALVDSGYREIVLTGINTALYGTEDGAACTLSQLLTMLDEIEAPEGRDFRVRLSSLEPTVVDKENVEEIIRHKRLCHHLHLSVQAGSDSVLKSMNRHYTRAEYLDIVRALRDYDPLFGITTDIIVGFPGETDKDFEDTLDLAGEAGFGRTHVFRYSPRRGTAGAALKDPVAEHIKKQRAELLEAAGDKAAQAFIRSNLGMTHTVLIEEINDGFAEGYTGNYIKVYIKAAASESDAVKLPDPGELADVVLTEVYRDGALAEL